MHVLDVPRRYATVFVCGGFGLGGNQDHDAHALARFRELLLPGGTLVMDIHAPYGEGAPWRYWQRQARRNLPEPWGPWSDDREASDGSHLALSGRVVDVDPISQVITREIRCRRSRAGIVEVQEQYALKERLYLRNELLVMLAQAGFVDVDVEADYTTAVATGDADVLVFLARRE